MIDWEYVCESISNMKIAQIDMKKKVVLAFWKHPTQHLSAIFECIEMCAYDYATKRMALNWNAS